jgi:adenylate cyclase
MKEQRKLAAIMFTDIVGYTAMMSKDEQHAHQISNQSRDIIRKQLHEFNGELLDTIGDGTLSCFASAVDAANCALEIQRSLKDDPELKLRIGIHIGDLVFKENDIYGDGVNVASRIEPLAEPGGICISGNVYRLIRNRPGIEAVFLGEKSLKNVDLPMKIYALVGEGLPATLAEPPLDKKAKPASVTKPSRRILLASVLIVAAIIGLYAVYSRYLAEPSTVSGVDEIKSIAVLPFVNMSADKDQEYFCDGLAEELLNMLAKVKELRVPARTSSFFFKGKDIDIATIGEKLNVESVLEGSVRKSGNNIRITTQLIKVSDGFHLWSETYDRKLDDIFAVQEEISRQVVDVLKVTLLGEEESALAGRPTENIEAYELYLQGYHHMIQYTEAALQKAVDYFTQAIEIDSSFALAYAGLAFTCIDQHRFANLSREEALSKAEEAVMKALSINDQLAEAHAALGYVRHQQFDYSEAEIELKKAIELNPNYMGAYGAYGLVLMDLGRWKDAQAVLEEALKIDPLSREIIRRLHNLLVYLGRFKEYKQLSQGALSWYGHLDVALWLQKSWVDSDPGNSPVTANLSSIYIGLGEYELAEKSLARAKELAPGKKRIGEIYTEDYLYLAQGQYTQYLQFAYNNLSEDPENEGILCQVAFAEMLIGDYDKALTFYERARSAYKQVGLPFGLQPWSIAAFGRTNLLHMAKAYFKTGEHEKGHELLTECRAFLGKLRDQGLGTPESYYFEASLNALGGIKQQALVSLRKAIDLGWRRSWFAKLDPPMELLRDDPEFKEMMEEVERDLDWMRVRGNVYLYSALAIIGLLIAYLIFLNRSTSRFASRYRKAINVSMGTCMALGIILGSVIHKIKIGEIIAGFVIGVVLEYKVGWPVLIFIFSTLGRIVGSVVDCMLLGVGVGMLVGFIRGRRGGVLSE